MTWCVCKYKNTGRMVVCSRESRELLLRSWVLLGVTPPSYVIKTFDKRKDAIKFIKEMKDVDKLLNQL